MATVIAEMTTSLDGFVTDPSGSAERLHPNLAALRGTAYLNAMIERTGAVLMGRRAFVDPNGADVVNLLVDLAYAALDPRVRYT